MSRWKRLTVRLTDDDVAIIDHDKGKTFTTRLHNTLQSIPKLKAEIDKLNEEIEKYKRKLFQHACKLVKEKEPSQSKPYLPSEKAVACLHRVESQGLYYCARLAPNFKEVDDVKLCKGCPHRITKAGLIFKKATGKTPSPLRERAKEKITFTHPDKRWCRRDKEWFFYGKKDCLRCNWLPTECKVRREVLKISSARILRFNELT